MSLPMPLSTDFRVVCFTLACLLCCANACPCPGCASAELAAGGRYLVIRDCLPPCFAELRTARASGGNYTVALAMYQDYLLFEGDIWQMPALLSSEGRVQCYAAGAGELPVQVPAGKLALVFECPDDEPCGVAYSLAFGQTPLDAARRDDDAFAALAAALVLGGMALCGAAALCGACAALGVRRAFRRPAPAPVYDEL